MQSPASSTICGTPGVRKNAKPYMATCIRIFWEKWCVATDKGTFGAAERFYLELSEDNRRILVERAVSIYDGRGLRNRNRNIKIKQHAGKHYQSDLQLMRLRSNGSTGIPGLRNTVPARIAGGGRLREDDMETACLNLGLELDYREYFINRLAGA